MVGIPLPVGTGHGAPDAELEMFSVRAEVGERRGPILQNQRRLVINPAENGPADAGKAADARRLIKFRKDRGLFAVDENVGRAGRAGLGNDIDFVAGEREGQFVIDPLEVLVRNVIADFVVDDRIVVLRTAHQVSADQLRHEVIALVVEMRAIDGEADRIEMIFLAIDFPEGALLDHPSMKFRGDMRNPDVGEPAAPEFHAELGRIGLLRDLGRVVQVIGLEKNFRRRPLARPADHVFVAVVAAVVVKDQEVRVKRIEIGLGSENEEIRREAADGAIFDDEINVGVTGAQIVADHLGPGLLRDRLPVKQDAEGSLMLRRAFLRAAHEALDAAAELILELEVGGRGKGRRARLLGREWEQRSGEQSQDR